MYTDWTVSLTPFCSSSRSRVGCFFFNSNSFRHQLDRCSLPRLKDTREIRVDVNFSTIHSGFTNHRKTPTKWLPHARMTSQAKQIETANWFRQLPISSNQRAINNQSLAWHICKIKQLSWQLCVWRHMLWRQRCVAVLTGVWRMPKAWGRWRKGEGLEGPGCKRNTWNTD